MSWQSPPLGAVHIDYGGARFLLGRTEDGYAIWDAAAGGAPLERYPLTAEGWRAAWHAYVEREGPQATQQAAGWSPSPTATWRRGQALAMAPMRVGEVLDGAFKLYRMHFGTLIPLVAMVQIPLVFLQFTILRFALGDVLSRIERGQIITEAAFNEFLRQAVVSGVVTAVIGLVATGFLTAALVLVAGDAFLGREVTIGATVRAALRRTLSVMWVLLLTGLGMLAVMVPAVLVLLVGARADSAIVALGVVLLLGAIVFAIVLYVRWLFGPAVVMLEGGRGPAALGRSWRLVRGLAWKVFGTWFLASLLAGLLGAVVSLPLEAVADAQEGLAGPLWYLYPIGGAIGALIATPFTILVIVLLYFDARMRKEGFDLEVMADQLGGRA